ncbi:hypothetical protein K493DRAFT_299707 [Basidiobolus meristosporus CBS 931.73]|uniref:FAR1 domain-containing protein n=1 Tax=Basidiobolus meristosporus CBS 931.73 TaxID=1314790 RepID=A0A1Y1YLF0_9FUNG|nr:hypothetical protein K493DRAFT_299707 [Basidiobolus meristosporus CBS 931.73]|eukprot:ORX98847.1 hypothetical protein K493DRAFT_299707 [Basidiobolus meristosporus CBS 931.73]
MDFREIFAMQFDAAQEAFEWCQQLAKRCGFGVRRRTSKSSTIYIVCSREGHPESKKNAIRKRNRTSERCNCDWRVVLYLTDKNLWEFRAGKCMTHNHYLSNDNRTPSRKRVKAEGPHLQQGCVTTHASNLGSPVSFVSMTPTVACLSSKPQLVPLKNLAQKHRSTPHYMGSSPVSRDLNYIYPNLFGTLRTPTSATFPLNIHEPRPFSAALSMLPPITTPPLESIHPEFEPVDSDTSEEEAFAHKGNVLRRNTTQNIGF